MTDREKKIKQQTTLKQNKYRSLEEIEKIVDKKIELDSIKNSFIGLKDDEIDNALELYTQYVTENSFENLAEKTTLVGMIYKEILKTRIQKFIKKESDEKDNAIPLQMTEKLMELDTQILSDKEKLGMLKDSDNNSFITAWNELRQKALNYYNSHSGETYVKCPECSKLFRLLMKIDNLEPAKATMFSGTTLYNLPLLNLYHQKRLTKEEMADILGTHIKYIDFIYNNLYLKEKEKS